LIKENREIRLQKSENREGFWCLFFTLLRFSYPLQFNGALNNLFPFEYTLICVFPLFEGKKERNRERKEWKSLF